MENNNEIEEKALPKYPPISHNFRTLMGFGKVISAIGWILVAIGCIAAVVLPGVEAGWSEMGLGGIIIGVLVAIQGLIIVAVGQSIICFVSIERYCRATFEITNKILDTKRE